MSSKLQQLIQKLEINEQNINTIIGAMVLFIVFSLLVNYYRTDRDQPTISPEDETIPQETATPDISPEGQTSSAATTRYQVKSGDTLWSIAENEYDDGYQWAEIAQINGINNPDLITEGMELDLPRRLEITAPYTEQPDVVSSDITQKPSSEQQIYTVKSGDSLWQIADTVYQDSYRWPEIWQANIDQIPNPDILLIGSPLTIP